MHLQENTLFANRYQLIKLLGRGGFSEVWLAKDNWTHLQIAIKVYAPGQGMDQDGLQDFCSELASVYDLNHSNLLKPQHVDTWQNMPYLIMAYCPAGSCVKRVGKMTEPELWKLIHDVAAGLAYLHEKDVIHQDIKPDNILVDTEGNYLITDFGISTRARSTLRKSVIGGNTSGGTTAYMGPERFSRQPAPTKASDIWSFGAMAFELLEGVTPFGEIGGGMQKGGAEIPFINAPVSDALKYTIFKMLSKETWDRPTAATLVEWANNPSSIEIDYSLLSEEGSSAQAQSVPASVAETPTPQPGGRATQRFNSVEPMATIDYNSSLPEQEKEDEVKVVNKGKNKTTVIEKIIYILSCCYGMGLVALFLSEIEPILNSGTMYIIFYLCTLFVLLFNSVIALIEVNKKCDAKIKRRFTETSVVNLYSCGILVGLGVIGFGEYAFVCCLPMVIVNFILQLIKSKRIITSPNKDLDKNSVSEDQRQKGLFKKILMILSCVLIPLFSGIDGELTFVLSTICSAIALILYLRKCKKISLVILALSIGIIFIPNHLMDSGYYASTIETQPVIETPQAAKRSTVQTQQPKTNVETTTTAASITISNAVEKISRSDRNVLDASIQNAKKLLDNLSADAYMDRASQKTEVLNLLNQTHLPIVENELLNLKQVKSIQISNYGIFEYSYFNCKFTSKNGSIYYKKTTGSQRQNGFLYRKDTNTVYFAGAWSVNDDPTKEYGSDQSIAGVFYKLSSGKYIMIMGDNGGVNILLFK